MRCKKSHSVRNEESLLLGKQQSSLRTAQDEAGSKFAKFTLSEAAVETEQAATGGRSRSYKG
jgi:hypothetical protein